MSYKGLAAFTAAYFAVAGSLFAVTFNSSNSADAAPMIAQARNEVAEVRLAREAVTRRMVARRPAPTLAATATAGSL